MTKSQVSILRTIGPLVSYLGVDLCAVCAFHEWPPLEKQVFILVTNVLLFQCISSFFQPRFRVGLWF